MCITLRLPGMLVDVATISSGCARDTSRAVETLTLSFVKSQIPPSTLAYKVYHRFSKSHLQPVLTVNNLD